MHTFNHILTTVLTSGDTRTRLTYHHFTDSNVKHFDWWTSKGNMTTRLNSLKMIKYSLLTKVCSFILPSCSGKLAITSSPLPWNLCTIKEHKIAFFICLVGVQNSLRNAPLMLACRCGTGSLRTLGSVNRWAFLSQVTRLISLPNLEQWTLIKPHPFFLWIIATVFSIGFLTSSMRPHCLTNLHDWKVAKVHSPRLFLVTVSMTFV